MASERRPHCQLCALWSSSDPTIKEITTYITESIGKVSISEICQQTSDNLAKHCEIMESKRNIFVHITQHTTDQRVVMGNIMRDLVEMSSKIKRACHSTCEETGVEIIDPKSLALYLKTVDQISNIYNMENAKQNLRKEN